MKEQSELDKRVDEGFFPELGGKTIDIPNRTDKNEVKKIHVTEMPVFYVKQFNRILAPLYAMVGGVQEGKGLSTQDLMNVSSIEKFEDDILNAAWYVVEYHSNLTNVKITKEYLGKNCSERMLLQIILAQLEVNGYVNFFKMLLKGVMTAIFQVQPELVSQNT